jgi:hypothetical protein
MTINQMRMMFLGSGVVIAGLVVQSHLAWVADFKVSAGIEAAKAETLRVQQSDIAIAEARFKNGCVQIGIEGDTPVQISKGMAVYGRSADGYRNPLADGTVICDRWGGTAVMQDGAAQQFASSPKYVQSNP